MQVQSLHELFWYWAGTSLAAIIIFVILVIALIVRLRSRQPLEKGLVAKFVLAFIIVLAGGGYSFYTAFQLWMRLHS